jgi:hypothetical protein
MAKECPFHKGGDAFRQEDVSSVGNSAQKLDSAWKKVLENRVFSSGSDWPSMSALMSEDYSSIYENKIDVKEAKRKVEYQVIFQQVTYHVVTQLCHACFFLSSQGFMLSRSHCQSAH